MDCLPALMLLAQPTANVAQKKSEGAGRNVRMDQVLCAEMYSDRLYLAHGEARVEPNGVLIA
jgi:hypothetical protein